jgi:molybdopterin-guanine dinucleotide biosynthesis protein A
MPVTVAVLAGGRGSRLGGDKALVELAGRPLIEYPLAAAHAAGLEAVVVAKPLTRLPPLDVRVLIEPDEPTHPLTGIVTALEYFEAVIAIPCDMPLLSGSDLSALVAVPGDVVVLASSEPFPALYRVEILPQLLYALEAARSMRATHQQLSARSTLASARLASRLMSVNTVENLAEAERRLSQPHGSQ